MSNVAVIAHKKKTFGGGLDELRTVLEAAGVDAPRWYEVEKSREAPKQVEKCLKHGVELIFAWGGDGTVQACIDALVTADAGSKVALAILPAGTANLLASNLGIPQDIAKAVDIGLRGQRRPLDVGKINGEHFAVMAGTGFDALMIRDADGKMKEGSGRAAYIWTGLKNLRHKGARARIKLDGEQWFKGRASCVLLGNVGSILGGIKAFPDAEPDDGQLEIGVVQADGAWDWIKVLARTALGDAEKSPLVCTGRARKIDIELDRKLPYQIDGGDRPPTTHLKIRARPQAITICTPVEEAADRPAEEQVERRAAQDDERPADEPVEQRARAPEQDHQRAAA